MIRTVALDVGYHHAVLDVGDRTFAPGEFTAIVGPNGVGKSAFVGTLCGRLAPIRGSVEVERGDIRALNAAARARSIAFVPAEDPTSEALLVEEAVLQGRVARRPWWSIGEDDADRAAAAHALAAVEMTAKRHMSTAEISSGEAQLVWLAMAIAQEAPTIILDEPTSHLDLRNAARVLRTLRSLAEEGRAVVAVLHDLSTAASYAHRVLVAGNGRILADGPPQIALDESRLALAYDAPVRVRFDADGTAMIGAVREVWHG